MVSPEIVTILSCHTTNTLDVPWPSTVNWSCPGPVIITLLSTSRYPLVRAIVPVAVMLIVSPSSADARAERRVFAVPSSAVVATVQSLAAQGCAAMIQRAADIATDQPNIRLNACISMLLVVKDF